jgi:hypothetical protein
VTYTASGVVALIAAVAVTAAVAGHSNLNRSGGLRFAY